MSLALRLPPFAERPAHPPEIRPSRVAQWLTEASTREPGFAARIIGEALSSTNRVSMSHSRRLDLAEQYWKTAALLWPRLEHRFIRASHPLQGDDLEAAKAALTLASELSTAYKRLLASEASRRLRFGGPRRLVALVRRTFQATSRVLANSYLSYAPVPSHTWYDAHEIYMYTRERKIHRHPVTLDQPDITLERLYMQSLLLALANPYGFLPSQLAMVLHFLQENAQLAKLTPVPPVHRMAKAVAIVPVGHDFPPFSANKGGNAEGSKLFLLTFDLAFQLQEQIRALEAGSTLPREAGADADARGRYVALMKRLLRQWAIPPARQFNRLPSRARVVMCAGLPGVWHYSRGTQHATPNVAPPPPMTQCQVVNHTSGGYALRQMDPSPAPLRVGDLIALRVEGRDGLQVAMVRWFRNTLNSAVLEFGCELLSDAPEAAAASAEDAPETHLLPVLVLPEEEQDAEAPSPQLAAPAGAFALEQAVSLRRSGGSGFAVLTKLVEQGPGFDLYEFVAVR
jgi:cyclic-di-GMP-binding protein